MSHDEFPFKNEVVLNRGPFSPRSARLVRVACDAAAIRAKARAKARRPCAPGAWGDQADEHEPRWLRRRPAGRVVCENDPMTLAGVSTAEPLRFRGGRIGEHRCPTSHLPSAVGRPLENIAAKWRFPKDCVEHSFSATQISSVRRRRKKVHVAWIEFYAGVSGDCRRPGLRPS